MVENWLKACEAILVLPLLVGKINGKAKLFSSHIWVMWILFDVIITISALEMGQKKMGHNVTLGKGVSVAQEILLEGY